ncbi:BGTF surface domain-containing protein [Haloarcula laminariae]|uniref:BGTF surface domain-containing protein n=1 Tax=Haloarcula laminariae TaxID=2961577 RepID=UPI0024056DBD|nr:BGTF surface domain-containing protein [Halomicroarcula sp. FL173]
MTARSRKCRSVFLTMLLVCSLVAMAGPLAGSASAIQTAGNTSVLTAGPNWYGQEFTVDVTQGSGGEFTAQSGDTVYLLEVDEGTDSVNRTARVLTVNSSGYINLETEELETDGRQAYALNDDNELNGGAVNFTLEPQTLDLEWERDSIATDSESVALETVESNRGAGEYNVTIRADGFDYEQLRALFVHSGTDLTEVTDRDHLPLEKLGFDPDDGDGLDDMRSAGYITLNLSTSTNFRQDGEIIANFSNLEANETLPSDGEYQFDIAVTDATTEDTAAITIGGAEADFEKPLYTRAAGDVAAFTVDLGSTDQTWVQLRDRNSEFVDVLYVEDDDGDGRVTFYANTRLMGTDHSELSGISEGDAEVVYHSNDTVQSYIHHETIPSVSGTKVGDAKFYDAETVNSSNEVTFSQYTQAVNGATPTNQLSSPLATTTYELVADRRGRFTVDDGEAAVDRPLGETELDLVQPTVRESNTYVAPEKEADSQRSIDELEANLTSRDAAAIGDRLVFRFNTTGIAGALAAIDYAQNRHSIDTGLSEGYGVDVFAELAIDSEGTDWEGEGVNFTLLGENPLNGPRDRLALEDGENQDAYFLLDQQTAEGDPGTLYAVVDTGSTAYDGSITDDEQYDAALSYIAGGRFKFSGQGPQGGKGGDATDPTFPYYDSVITENVTERRTVSFESTTLTFDAVDDGTVALEPARNARVSGDTNLAPGTSVTLGVRLAPPSDALPDEDPSFLAQREITVNADGTFNATFDLSDRTVGEAATVRVERGQTTVGSSDAEFANVDAVQGPYFETELDVPPSAQRNETVRITGTVTNTGEEAGTADVTITATGTNPVRGIFDLDTGESRRINHSVRMEQTAIDVRFESQDTSQQSTVEYEDPTAPATPTPTQTPTSTSATAVDGPQSTPPPADTGGGGFPWLLGGVGAAVTLTGAALLVIRWL